MYLKEYVKSVIHMSVMVIKEYKMLALMTK